MKRLSIIAFTLLCTSGAFAQDRVITKDGDVFEAYRIDIGSTYVYYTKEDKDDAALQKIAKADVLMVKKKDGTKIDVTAYVPESASNPTAQTASKEQPGITQVKPEDLPAEAKAANDALIAKINAPVELEIKEKHQEDIGKRAATCGYACFGVDPSRSVLCNEDIEVSMEIRRLFKASKKSPAEWNVGRDRYGYALENPGIRFSIKNKTSQTLYLDLANTFYVTMEQSTCYYIPSSTTTSNTSSGGGSVNLGSITGALGIGGTVGSLANGVNVGGGSSNTTSSTTFSQRIIAIAPSSTVNLSPQYLFCNEEKSISTGLKYCLVDIRYTYIYGVYANFSSDSQAGAMMYGDHYVYNPESSPVKMSFFVAYSKTENCASTNVLPLNLYLKDLLGQRYNLDKMKNNDIPYMTIGITNNKRKKSFPKQ